MSSEDFLQDLKKLADRWCERRALRPLSIFLPAYLSLNGLTDGYAQLENALKDVLALASGDITEEEKREAKRLLILVQQAIYQR
jgi:hypothetical protein